MAAEVTLDKFFEGFGESRPLFDCVCAAIQASPSAGAAGPRDVEQRVTKSQVAFRSVKQFAWVWIPARHLGRRAAPLVLSLGLPARDASPRWKQIVEPASGRFMHHLEIYAQDEINDEVRGWIRKAYDAAS